MDGREGFESWFGEEIALEEADSLTGEELIFGEGFDSLGDHVNLQVVAGAANGTQNCLAGTAAVDAADEAHVELDLIGLEVIEKGEAGEGGAEVVDGEADAEGAGILNENGEMGAVVDDADFGDFEDDAVGAEARLLSSFDGGEDRFRIRVETLRQEIEVERAIDAEATSESDGGDASGLIEEVEIWG